MTFISYAQNFEDVMLWRALRDVHGGFYIDVGAWSPDLDSVTKAFSERGWRGINIEPNPVYFTQIEERRPRDINLRLAIGDHAGIVPMTFFEGSGLSTADARIAREHVAAGWKTTVQDVRLTTLANIWREHVEPSQAVHFLKIDVEGFETAALAGNDWESNRPWVVVVEATLPLTQIESHADWEHILIGAHYSHCYSDGLNRYYLAAEHPELLDAFRYPPNVFDGFVTANTAELTAKAQTLTTSAEGLSARAEAAELRAQEVHSYADRVQAEGRAYQAHAEAAELRAQADARAFQDRFKQTEQELERARQVAEVAEIRRAEAERFQHEMRRRADVHAAELHAALRARDAIVNEANQRVAITVHQHREILASTSWRLTSPLRSFGSLVSPNVRRQARRAAKAAWWLVTPWLLPARLRFIRNRNAVTLRTLATQRESAASERTHMPIAPTTGHYAEWIRAGESRSGLAQTPVLDGPLVSFLVSVSGPFELVSRTISSVRSQQHRNWELILCRGHVESFGLDLGYADARIVLVDALAGDRPSCLKAAAERAKGKYVAVLDCGDILAPSALNEIVHASLGAPEADILYSDEDIQSATHFRDAPQFKPGWSPDLLYAFNYFGRLTLLRRAMVFDVGNFDVEAGAAVEWDLNLRMSDRAQFIERIPKVLCHRVHGGVSERPASQTLQAAEHRSTIEKYWSNFGFSATAMTQPDGTQRTTWPIMRPPLVSVIIPTKNKPDLLKMCIDGLVHGTDYSNKEIVIVDTGSDDAETLSFYEKLKEFPEIRVVHFLKKFNYSSACNYGASCARGELLLFLNNDIEVISRDWLQEMVRFAMRPGVGVVGTKLIYPSLELQHAGVAVGIHLAALMYRSAGGQSWGVFGSPEHPRNWLAIMGACQLVTRQAFERVGGFDESYQVAMSDVALCMQAWRAGYRTAYAPHACLVHHEGATRGNTNPVEDVRRLADDIRMLGIDEDPYLHPELDGQLAIPTIRINGAPSVREILQVRLREDGSLPAPSKVLDLTTDGVCLDVAGLPRDRVIWQPQAAHKVADKWSAARWCLDLLRTRSDVRVKFPTALSEGKSGGFFRWLMQEGRQQFELPMAFEKALDQLFSEDLAASARQAFLFRSDVRVSMPHGLTPAGNFDLFRWFIQHGRTEIGLRLEEIWWLFWEAAEQPSRELVRAYKFTPHWQNLFPFGITIFGSREFSAWFAATYRVTASWVDPSQWPVGASAANQIRSAYHGREYWRSLFPSALSDASEAMAFIDWLQSDNAKQPAEIRKWCASLDAPMVAAAMAAPGANVIGHFCYPSGLRVSVEALVEGLHRAGVSTSLRDLRTDKKDDPHHVDFDGFEDFDTTIVHTQPEPFFSEAYERSDLFARSPKTYRVAYWYWEFDSIPDFWVTQAAKVDEVWAATEFVAKGLRERLSIPVRTLFPGVKLGPYQQRHRSYFGLKGDEFTFLFTFHMMSIMERKNPLGLIRAFKSAFQPNEPVRLVLKTSFGDRHPAQIEELRAAAAGSNITIIDQVYSPDEVLSLMDTCDAYVSLHRSEGLGLTIAEAMLMGKPVIATNYSGNVDFTNDSNSLLVPYELVKLGRPIPPYDAESVWAEPSTEEAARLMRRVYMHQDWARELGARAKINAEANLSPEAAGRRIAARLMEITVLRRPQAVD